MQLEENRTEPNQPKNEGNVNMGSGYDQRSQHIHGDQTNITGNQYILAGTPAGAPIDLDTALARLAELPTDHVPAVAALPPGSWMPLSPNPYFVGRQPELLALARTLQTGGTAHIVPTTAVAATGLGGIGKTQLASAFVHCYGQYFLGGVFWLSFADPAAVAAEIAQCAAWMSDLPAAVTHLPLTDQVQRVRLAWQEPFPRLFILDNCEDPALLETWRPKTGGCRVLITSRRARWPGTQAVTTVTVGTLPRAESIALLAKFAPAPAQGAGWDAAVLDAIAAELGDLPLALHMAGNYLAQVAYDVSPAAYLAQLRRPDLLDHISMQTGDFSPTGHELHVARTFALSYGRLDSAAEVDVTAQHILACIAHFAPGEPIPRWLLRRIAGLAGEEKASLAAAALGRLVNLGLIEEEAAGSLRLHRLVQRFVTAVLGEKVAQVQRAVEESMLAEAGRLHSTGDPRALGAWQVHLRQVTAVAQKRQDELTAELCNRLGVHLDAIGDYKGAWVYYERTLVINQALFGAKHPKTATSLHNLGAIRRAMGDYAGARTYYEMALAIRQAVLAKHHRDTTSNLNSLGMVLMAMGDYTEARVYLEQVLAIRRAVLGKHHLDTGSSLNNLGLLLQDIGDYVAARPYFEQGLAITEATLGEHHPHTTGSLTNLGTLLLDTEDYTGAKPYLERTLAIYTTVLGETHPHTATALSNLGGLSQATGDYAGARSYYERALVIRQAVFGEQHPATAQSLNNLGVLAYYADDKPTAETCLAQALVIYEAFLGPNHPDTQQTRQSLAAIRTELTAALKGDHQ